VIDADDVGDGFIFGGVAVGLVLLVCYFVFSKPVIDACEKNGGVIVKSNGESICVRKDSLIKVEQPK
jgi:hypothetical protein